MADNTIEQQTVPAEGESISRDFTVKKPDGTTKDLTNMSVKWYLLPERGSDATNSIIDHGTSGVSATISDAAAGEVSLEIDQGVTDGEDGRHWQLLVLDDSGEGLQKWGGSYRIELV